MKPILLPEREMPDSCVQTCYETVRRLVQNFSMDGTSKAELR